MKSFFFRHLAVTLIQPCSAADNYEIIAAISSYSSLEYYHQAIVLDNKNNQAKHCEVTITLGAVPKAKSSCVALRDLADEALSPWRPAAQAGHIGLRPQPAPAKAGVSSMKTSRLGSMSP